MYLKDNSVFLITLYCLISMNNGNFIKCTEVNTSINTLDSQLVRQKRDFLDDILSYFLDNDYFADDEDGDEVDYISDDNSPADEQKFLICSNCTVVIRQEEVVEQTTATTMVATSSTASESVNAVETTTLAETTTTVA